MTIEVKMLRSFVLVFVALWERALTFWPMYEEITRIEQEISADGTGVHQREESALKSK